jgi:glycosyltransferase involved in cell wall biosynthesis
MDQPDISNTYVLIPAYEPVPDLVDIVRSLSNRALAGIIIVNDGSSAACQPIFEQLKAEKNVILLTHEKNQGKGAALKTGFAWLQACAPNCSGVVTADADGQHLLKDIVNVAHALAENPDILAIGSRQFAKNVPFRSLFGNLISRHVFKFLYGKTFTDTQTGLRGLPMSFVNEIINMPYNGYEFEAECLVLAVQEKFKTQEIAIDTVYLDNNATSHFNPIVDSIKIYYVFFRYLIMGLFSFLIDIGVFIAIYDSSHQLFTSLVIARMISGAFNFYKNQYLIYRSTSKKTAKKQAKKYLFFSASILLISFVAIKLLLPVWPAPILRIKVTIDIILYIVNFILQRYLHIL